MTLTVRTISFISSIHAYASTFHTNTRIDTLVYSIIIDIPRVRTRSLRRPSHDLKIILNNSNSKDNSKDKIMRSLSL